MRRQTRLLGSKGGGDRRGGHDPDYEEVGPVIIHLRHTPDGRGDGKHCEVCGAAQATVRCESCSGQVFCTPCDHVFHQHPRRTQHLRKNMEGVRPPLPPKGSEGGQSVPPPQPPPRKNKRGFLGGGAFSRKDQNLTGSMMSLRHDPSSEKSSFNKKDSSDGGGSQGVAMGARTIMGSLKRFMGSRPLPPTPGGTNNHRGTTNVNGIVVHSNLIRSITSPNLVNDVTDTAIPQTIVDLSNNNNNNNNNNSTGTVGRVSKYPAPAPPTATPPYPVMMPRPLVGAPVQTTLQTQQRKLSLQTPAPNSRDEKRQSMIDGASWDTSGRPRSQSISDEQWSQLLAAQGHHAPPPPPPPHQVNDTTSNRFSSAGAASVRGVAPGRGGMMSSTSVCNLNTLAQPYQQPLSLQQQQLMPLMGGMHQSGSFQQLNMVPYNGGMMWSPPPCDMCHVPPMYPPPLPSHGMKRAASNISMNMSSASSDVTGYPWQQHMHQPHMHHPMYPGYYPPPPPPPHILPTSMQGSSISIPDSMAAFNKVSSSPAPSVRSSSRRSHRSNKSRSFSTADLSRRTRSTHRSDSDESTSSSPSMEEEVHSSRPSYPGGPLAWQCDHCTFINQAGSRVCGMCSKTQGSSSHSKASRKNSERRRSERRYISRRNDRDDDDREPSDYDNDGKHTTLNTTLNSTQYNNTRDNRRDKSSKSSISSRSKKKLRRRGGSSGSASDVVDELERQLSDLKVSKSRGPEYDGGSSKLREREKDRDRERGSRRREGLSGRYKSRSKKTSERSRTPGRPSPDSQSTPQGSPRDDSPQDDDVFAVIASEDRKPDNNNSNSNDGTLIAPMNSDDTIPVTQYRKTKSDSHVRRSKSAISSRPSTPGPAADVQHAVQHSIEEYQPLLHHAEVKMLAATDTMEVANPLESKQSDHLNLPKCKEKSPSPFRQNSQADTEEPSFANTLDDIATMGTNEVADIDPYMDERPLSALPINIDDIRYFIPTAHYIEPISQNEEPKETAQVSLQENYVVEKANSCSIKIELSETKEDAEPEKEVKIVPQSLYGEEINHKTAKHSYVDVEINLENVINYEEKGNADEKYLHQKTANGEEISDREDLNQRVVVTHSTKPEYSSNVYDTEDEKICNENPENRHSPIKGSFEDVNKGQSLEDVRPMRSIEQGNMQSLEDINNVRSLEDIKNAPSLEEVNNIRPSSSFASSVGFGFAQHDRQYTPLSFSSSDAAFYSPADSTDDSLDEKLKEKPSASQTQVIEQPAQCSPATKHVRKTLYERGADPPPRRMSHTGAVEAPRALSPTEVGYLSSDAYEGLSFQDAVSGSLDQFALHRSASDQLLSARTKYSPEKQSPRSGERKRKEGKHPEADERLLTVEEFIAKRKQETMKKEGLQLVQVIREAEKAGFEAEEVSVALPLCGDRGPLEWLTGNWRHMVNTVRTLATNYGREKQQNNIGDITEEEARAALRAHKGNIWAAVTESVEQRQNKFAEVSSKGDFDCDAVSLALARCDGDAQAAYQHLSKVYPRDAQDLPPYDDQDYSQIYSNVSTYSDANFRKPKRLPPPPPPPLPPTSSKSTKQRQQSPQSQRSSQKQSRSHQPEQQSLQHNGAQSSVMQTTKSSLDACQQQLPRQALDAEDSIYSSIAGVGVMNPALLAKTEILLQELEEEAPMLSRDLKLKIVQAILEEEPNSSALKRHPSIDSDEESTIEELLARDQNPTFYEYFTAVELDEDGEDYQEMDDGSEPASHSFFELVKPAPVPADDDDLLYVRREGSVCYTDASTDVVVQPLKTYPHYADLSVSNISTSSFSDARENIDQTDGNFQGQSKGQESLDQKDGGNRESNMTQQLNSEENIRNSLLEQSVSSKGNARNSTSADQSTNSRSTITSKFHISDESHEKSPPVSGKVHTDASKIAASSGDETSTVVVKREKPSRANDLPRREVRSFVTYEEGSSEEEEEEESVSITTGRLSLTLSHSSDKEGAIDVTTAATVQREDVQTEMSALVRSAAGGVRSTVVNGGERDISSVTRMSDIRHIPELEEQASSNPPQDSNQTPQTREEREGRMEEGSPPSTDHVPPTDVEIPAAPDKLSDAVPATQDNISGEANAPSAPVGTPPVKKASSIIGKAIAKAMARESTVKEDHREGSPSLYSPESSRGSTPGSLTQDSTQASSFIESEGSTPVSTTPMSTTPRSTPDLTEDANCTVQVSVDSEDEDLLRSLDTIPEEEEISERTESGRLLSRSSSKNLKLPFSPTSVVRLGTPTALKPKEKSCKENSSSSSFDQTTSQHDEDYNSGSLTTKSSLSISSSNAVSSPAVAAIDISDTSNVDSGAELEMTADSDQYQDTRLSEKSDDPLDGDSDSSTPRQMDNNMDDEDNSLALIPQPETDIADNIDNSSGNTTNLLADDDEREASVLGDVSEGPSSTSSHNYYNTLGGLPRENTYYNDAAIKALKNEEKIKIDPNDYESMYSIKRELDLLRESSSEVSNKIESLEPLKDSGSTKLLKSALKQTASVSMPENRTTESADYPSSPMSGAQLLAEENQNTVKRSPKTSARAKSSTTQAGASEAGPSEESKTPANKNGKDKSEATNGATKSKTSKTKVKQKKKSDSDYSSSDQTDASKSNEDTTVIQTTVSKEATTKPNKNAISPSQISSKQDSDETGDIQKTQQQQQSSVVNQTVKPKTPTPVAASVVKKGELRQPGGGPSAFSPPSPTMNTTTSPETRGIIDSSGESEDEDNNVAAQRLESLKGREPDPEEVQDLKKQMTELKRSLQSQISDEERGSKSPLPKIPLQAARSGAGTPVITVEEAPDGDRSVTPAGGATLASKTEEEVTQYEQLRFDRTVRRLLAEGQAGSYEKAELAAHLLSLSFDEEDSIAAAQECSSIYGAMHYLQQDCELCAEKLSVRNMVAMLFCTHRCCRDCAKTYFTYQIKTKNIRDLRCPFCNEPGLDTSEDSMTEYFTHLDIQLKGIVDEEIHELFQRKLRDLNLMSDPNFRWCNKCSSGFIANPRARKLICPDCMDVTCAHCRLKWEAQHEGISCHAFAKWKQENDPESQAQGVAKHLAENGITCPKCKFQYSLAKGGCMHFTCTECKYEFCSGCGQPFRQGVKCPVGPYCERLGLHAHHPRNCLFYLRDKDPPQLQQLLKENNVQFDTTPPEGEEELADDDTRRRYCQVPEQKELPEGLVDDTCGRTVVSGYAGLCRLHYVEYLVEKINSHHLDPVIIFDEADMRVCLRRNGKTVPIRRWENEKLYRDKLIKLIKEQLPL